MNEKILITDLDDTLYDWIGFFIPAFYGLVDEIASITGISKDVLLAEYKKNINIMVVLSIPLLL